MKRSFIFSVVALCALAGCESTGYTPPLVTTAMAKTNAKQHVDLVTLREGRQLFASRCIECHTLPPIARYHAQEWPCLVDTMAPRANLKPKERDAIVAYLCAARSQ